MNRTTKFVTCLLAAAVCAATIAGCSGRRSEQRRIEGDAYFRLTKYDEAKQAYRAALDSNPDNVEAKFGMARIALVESRVEDAVDGFLDVIEQDPTFEEAYVEVVKVRFDQGRLDDALAIADSLSTVNEVRGGILRSLLFIRNNDPSQAIDELTALRDKYPDSAEVRINLGAVYAATKQFDQAEVELAYVVDSIDPDNVAARVNLIEAYRGQGRTEEVVQTFEDLLSESPDNVSLKLAYAMSLMYAGRPEDAETTAREVLDTGASPGWANYVIGSSYLARDDYDAAIPFLRSAVNELPGNVAVERQLAAARSGGRTLTAGRPGPVRPDALPADDRDWKSLWRMGALETLISRVNELRTTDDRDLKEALVFTALFTNRPDLARDLAKDLPADAPAVRFLAALDEALEARDPNLILEHYKSWNEDTEMRRTFKDNAYGYALALGGARGEALKVYSAVLQKWPDNMVCLYNIANVFRSTRSPQYAARAVEQIISKYPDNVDAHLFLYRIYGEAGMQGEARRAAEAAFVIYPDNPRFVINLAEAYLKMGMGEQAENVLNRVMQSMPEDPSLLLAMAGVQLQMDNIDAAKENLEAALPSFELSAPIGRTKSLIAARMDDWPAVRSHYANAAVSDLNAVDRYLYATARLKNGEDLGALRPLFAEPGGDSAMGGQTENVVWMALGGETDNDNADAALARKLADDREALARLTEALAYRYAGLADQAYDGVNALISDGFDEPFIVELALAVLSTKTDADVKRADAQRFVEQYGTRPGVWIEAASVMKSLESTEEEGRMLERAAELAPDNVAALSALASYYDRANDVDKAIETYRRLAELRPDSVVTNNNLAYNLIQSGGDAGEALRYAQKALERDGNNPSILHTVGVAQMRTNALDQSFESLNRAKQLRPGDPDILFDLGKLLIEMDRAPEGKSQIQLAVQYTNLFGLDFDRQTEALELIQQ